MHNQVNIEKCLTELSKKRKFFHCEADFQFALAWEIQILYPTANIRIEYPVKISTLNSKLSYVDIVVAFENQTIFIELKYKTAKLEFNQKDEIYALKEHGAQDLGKYDSVKDIERIEALVNHKNKCGYTIWLTNDCSYLKEPTRDTVMYKNFAVANNSEKYGELAWQGNPKPGTIIGREASIILQGIYRIQWKTYSSISEKKNGIFYYAINKICKNT